MKKLLLIFTPLLVALSGGLLLLHQPAAQAATPFNPNDLMDDAIFTNAGTMSAAQIDAWLNSNFPSSCISTNNGFSSPDPTGYSPSAGFTYGANVSAGQVIYDAAQAYGINPQVLLTTLQKESSVVSGDAAYHCQYINTAMGYGCPDSGSCPTDPATMSGFSKQVIHAAWLFMFGEQRSHGNISWNIQKTNTPEAGDVWNNSDDPQTCYGGPMTQGSFKRCSTDSSPVFYDGTYTIDGTGIQIQSGATAALYWYTPHFSGNQNFQTLFLNWFGSPWMTNTGPAKGGNATSTWAPGRLDVFAEGTNSTGPNIYHKWYSGQWFGWELLPTGSDRIASTPAVASRSNEIDTFARGTGGDLLRTYYVNGWNSDWESLGGQILGAPTVASWASDRLDVFVEGTNDTGPNLYHKWWSGYRWFDWESVPVGSEHITSAPAAISWSTGRIDVFARGESGDLVHAWFDGTWHDWESLGGQIVGAPAVASWAPGRLDVFAEGTNVTGPNVYHKSWSGQWSTWEQLPTTGNTRVFGSLSATSWDSGRIDVFARGESGDQLHSWLSNGRWFGWESLGGSLAP